MHSLKLISRLNHLLYLATNINLSSMNMLANTNACLVIAAYYSTSTQTHTYIFFFFFFPLLNLVLTIVSSSARFGGWGVKSLLAKKGAFPIECSTLLPWQYFGFLTCASLTQMWSLKFPATSQARDKSSRLPLVALTQFKPCGHSCANISSKLHSKRSRCCLLTITFD